MGVKERENLEGQDSLFLYAYIFSVCACVCMKHTMFNSWPGEMSFTTRYVNVM